MRYYVIFFILYEIAISFYFYRGYEDKLHHNHENTIKLVEHTLNTTINTFELANNDFHSHHVHKFSTLTNRANGASVEERNKVCEELLELLRPYFANNKLNFREDIHMFDKNGHSLFKLNQPEKYDENVTESRTSLQNMSKNFSYQKGIEICAHGISYRFLYPLFHDGNFVGSYEYSVSFDRLKLEMEKFFANEYTMLYRAQNIESVILLKTIKENYQKINIGSNEFYYDSLSFHDTLQKKHFEYILTLDKVQKSLSTNDVQIFHYIFEEENFHVLIRPALDISNKHIGYMFVHVDDDHISHFKYELFVNIFLASLFSLMFFIYMIILIRYKTYIRELINLQHEIIVVTDGKKIKDANNTLLKFFGYETLKEFKQEHLCICEFFIEDDGFLQEKNAGVLWTEYILKHQDKTHKVKMKDISDNTIKVFELEYELLKESKYLFVEFRDITDEVAKIKELMNRAYYDTLTNIYNRSSFEYHLKKELMRSSRNNTVFSLIMFDIDHFKLVNDDYGHDVGDYVLKELSSLISSHIREIDIFARWGGEEFMIISTTNIFMGEEFAEKLREIIQNHKFKHVSNITCSFGVTQYHVDDTEESIVKRCDNMLYSAKESGRNCVASVR